MDSLKKSKSKLVPEPLKTRTGYKLWNEKMRREHLDILHMTKMIFPCLARHACHACHAFKPQSQKTETESSQKMNQTERNLE